MFVVTGSKEKLIKTRNYFMAVITFICLFIITMSFVYLIVRKAVVKRD